MTNIIELAKQADLLYEYGGYIGSKHCEVQAEEYIAKLTKFAQLLQQQDNAKPDVYDIAVDTGDGTYWTAEVVHFQQNDNVRKIQVRIPQQGSQLLQQGEPVACEKCGGNATKNVIYTNVSQTEHPICEHCAWQHEQTANEINQHEMDNFGGAYGLVTFQYTPLFTTPPETQQKLDKAREALTKIASLTQTENLLWWQIEARQALKEIE